MRSRTMCGSAALALALAAAPAITLAQIQDTTTSPVDRDEQVFKYDLSGPRIGATLLAGGDATSQFGWHFESQVSPTQHGPWFIVERVLLVGGTERDAFVPTGTLIFGVRLANSVEFGLGPSLTVGGDRGANTGIVLAAGHSFRVGGIRVPVNLACAMEKGGEQRWTVVTGWAIRDQVGRPAGE